MNPAAAADQALLTAAALALPGATVAAPPQTAGMSGAAMRIAAAVPTTAAPSVARAEGHAVPAAGLAARLIAGASATIAPAPVPACSNDTLDGAASSPDINSAKQGATAAAFAQGSDSPQRNSPDLTVSEVSTALARGAPAAPAVPTAPGLAAAPAGPAAVPAAAIAQVVIAAGGPAGADKHSRGGTSDSFVPDAPNGGAAAVQLLTSANPSAAESLPTRVLTVSAGVDSAEFGQGVASHLGIMMDGNLGSAKLQVNPPALGPIEVRIALQAGHAQVWLASHSAVTCDALEASTSKLREMLGAQGFGQVSVDISQRSFQERSPQPRGYEGPPIITPDAIGSLDTGSALAHTASGLLDAYA